MISRIDSSGLTTVAIALGSNMGKREAHLAAAVSALRDLAGFRVVSVSQWIETAPVGGPAEQRHFLNGALVGETELAPRELLGALQDIEQARGRVRIEGERDGPRPLDLDLLVFGSSVIEEPDLSVPHPRMAQRDFVLIPLASIAPDLLLPPTDKRVADLLRALQTTGAVELSQGAI